MRYASLDVSALRREAIRGMLNPTNKPASQLNPLAVFAGAACTPLCAAVACCLRCCACTCAPCWPLEPHLPGKAVAVNGVSR